MFNFIKSKKEKDRAILGIIICAFLLIIGNLVLTFIATLEDPPLGHTVYILIGTSLMAIGGLGIAVILKYLYDLNIKKKRKELKRKKHKVVFLKNNSLEKKKK